MSESNKKHFPPRQRARGFTLVEALVALLVLSIGLLGIAALQMAGLRTNMGAAWRSQATYLSYDIIDRMRANRNNANAYAVGYGAAPGGASTAALDLQAWKANLATLPSGDGQVVVNNRFATVTIRWNDQKADRAELAAARGENVLQFTFEMQSRI